MGPARTIRRLLLAALVPACALAANPPGGPPPATTPQPAPTVITGAMLQGLDRTTARVTKFEAPLGKPVPFGTLRVTVKDCRKRPPVEQPESAAYLDIEEIRPGQAAPDHLFSGWMFASSPAVNALEHPVYDVWLLDCTTSTGSSSKAG